MTKNTPQRDEKSWAMSVDHARDLSASAWADALRDLYPMRSDAEVAELAAQDFQVSKRQVLNWLAENNTPSMQYLTLAGARFGLGVLVNLFAKNLMKTGGK